MTWDEIARSDERLTTDKASRLPVGGGRWQIAHGYLAHYETILAGWQPKSILEIGVAGGHSLRLWSRLFPNAIVAGMDIDAKCAGIDVGSASVVIADATQPDAWQLLIPTPNGACSWDVIVDDGSHNADDVLATFDGFHERLSPGGLYFIEDMAPGFIGTLLVQYPQWSATLRKSSVSTRQCLAILRSNR